MGSTDGDGDLPDPEIETIRNLVGTNTWDAVARLGALVKFDGPGVRDHSMEVSTLTRVMEHFDRLVRIMQAYRGGLEVKSHGPITEVSGAGRLAVLPSAPGSFALPVLLEPPAGQMFAVDYEELERVVGLLLANGTDLAAMLTSLPDRIGDELVELLRASRVGRVDLGVYTLRNGQLSAHAEVSAKTAARRVEALEQAVASDTGHQTLRGYLWRIDAKHHKATIDAAAVDDETSTAATVMFTDDQLEQLRPALRGYVEVEVSVVEQRRSYEQAARSREMHLLAVSSWVPDDDAD